MNAVPTNFWWFFQNEKSTQKKPNWTIKLKRKAKYDACLAPSFFFFQCDSVSKSVRDTDLEMTDKSATTRQHIYKNELKLLFFFLALLLYSYFPMQQTYCIVRFEKIERENVLMWRPKDYIHRTHCAHKETLNMKKTITFNNNRVCSTTYQFLCIMQHQQAQACFPSTTTIKILIFSFSLSLFEWEKWTIVSIFR